MFHRTIRPSYANSTMRIYTVPMVSDASSCTQNRSPRRRILTMCSTLKSSGSILSWPRAKLLRAKSLLPQMHKSLSNSRRGTQDLPLKTYSGKGSGCLSSPLLLQIQTRLRKVRIIKIKTRSNTSLLSRNLNKSIKMT